MFREIKYAYQRITRGYSDRDCWDIDHFLSTIIPPMVRKLKIGSGCPSNVFDKEAKNNECHKWYDILEEIAQGFEACEAIKSGKASEWISTESGGLRHEFNEEKNKQLTIKYERSMELFAKHFMGLWD